jgi:hypothetical protein
MVVANQAEARAESLAVADLVVADKATTRMPGTAADPRVAAVLAAVTVKLGATLRTARASLKLALVVSEKVAGYWPPSRARPNLQSNVGGPFHAVEERA